MLCRIGSKFIFVDPVKGPAFRKTESIAALLAIVWAKLVVPMQNSSSINKVVLNDEARVARKKVDR